MKEAIRDKRRMIIGYVDKKLNGEYIIYNKSNLRLGIMKPSGSKLYAFDKSNRRLGYWDERTNTTYDKNNKRMGKGNLLIGFYFI